MRTEEKLNTVLNTEGCEMSQKFWIRNTKTWTLNDFWLNKNEDYFLKPLPIEIRCKISLSSRFSVFQNGSRLTASPRADITSSFPGDHRNGYPEKVRRGKKRFERGTEGEFRRLYAPAP